MEKEKIRYKERMDYVDLKNKESEYTSQTNILNDSMDHIETKELSLIYIDKEFSFDSNLNNQNDTTTLSETQNLNVMYLINYNIFEIS